MTITAVQIAQAVQELQRVRNHTPWYKPFLKFRLTIMIETLLGVIDGMVELNRAQGRQAYNNHYAN